MAKGVNAESRDHWDHINTFSSDQFDLESLDADPLLRTDRAVNLDREAVPVSIASRVSNGDSIPGKLIFSNGKYVFKPIPGYEHQLHSLSRVSDSARFEQKLEQRTVALADNTHKKRPLKRKSSLTVNEHVAKSTVENNGCTDATGLTQTSRRVTRPFRSLTVGSRNSHLPVLSHSVAEPAALQPINAKTTNSFHIGDIAALKRFWKAQLEECNLQVLRKVLESWIQMKWPHRRDLPYSSTQNPTTKRAFGWPTGVPYISPAHLKRDKCVELTCYLLLANQERDDQTGLYRINWIETLKKTAERYMAKGIYDRKPANSKRQSNYRYKRKVRFAAEIWPLVMKTAQDFENHIAQYYLHEGNESYNPNVQKGKEITWSKINKMLKVKKPKHKPPKKRACRTPPNAVEVDEDINDISYDDHTLLQTGNGEAGPGNPAATETMSFLSTLRDCSISPVRTLSDEENLARVEASTIPDLECDQLTGW